MSESPKVLDRRFDEGVSLAWKRVADLEARLARLEGAEVGGAGPAAMLREAVAEFHAVLEELSVAQEELRAQNGEVVRVSRITEVERQRYEDLFQNAPHGYLITDPDGIIREANLAAARLLGLEQRFLIGRPFATFLGEEDRRAVRAGLARIGAEDVEEEEWEVEPVPREGDPYHASLTVSAQRNGEGKLVSLRCMLRDISPRKEVEEELRALNEELERRVEERTRELKQASVEKSRFLTMVSHELRTPLNAVMVYNGMLGDVVPVTEHPKAAEYVERIDASTRHLADLIEQVLRFARMESGRDSPRIATVDPARVAREALTVIEPLAARQHLPLQVAIATDLPPLETDAGKLRQVLLNLLANAVNFTDKGRIDLRVERLEDGDGGRKCVCFAVHDTGIGIAEDDLEVIFRPFRRVAGDAGRERPGTGLGLSVVRRLVEMLGGTVEVESTPGAGSVFRVTMPCVAPAHPEKGEAKEGSEYAADPATAPPVARPDAP